MLDRDGRRDAAEALRELGEEITGRSHSDENIERQDQLCALADALEAEPEGYDYETAAAERGEALVELVRRLRDSAFYDSTLLSGAIARAEEVMEGVALTHAVVPIAWINVAAHYAGMISDQGTRADEPEAAERARELEAAFYAAGRGERPVWPTTGS